MFLSQLNQMEKTHYYRLAQIAAEANGDVNYEEANYLEIYRKEMSLCDDDIADVMNISSHDIVNVFSVAKRTHKNIVLFETIAFMYVDGSFDDEEKQFTYRFANQIGFTNDDVDKIIALVSKYVACLAEIAEELL